jgi:hypothetical protein
MGLAGGTTTGRVRLSVPQLAALITVFRIEFQWQVRFGTLQCI